MLPATLSISSKTKIKIVDKKIIEDKDVNIFYEAAFQDSIEAGAKIFTVDVVVSSRNGHLLAATRAEVQGFYRTK